MDRYDIEKLRDLPIEGVAERLGLSVSRHRCLCPFHPDTHPSLSFRPSLNRCKCWSCSASANTIELTMQVLNKGFREACEWLANENNIITTDYKPAVKVSKSYPPDVAFLSELVRYPVLTDAAKHFLFEERHLNPKVIEWCGISSISTSMPCWRNGKPFYDAPALLFPYRDFDGRVQNVQSRFLGDAKKMEVPRFRFPYNSSIHIFNLPVLRLLKAGEPLYVSEGITDCLALLSAGHKAIAIPSATLLNDSDFKILVDVGLKLGTPIPLHCYPDQDSAGSALFDRLLSLSLKEKLPLIRHSLPAGCKDFSDFWVKGR